MCEPRGGDFSQTFVAASDEDDVIVGILERVDEVSHGDDERVLGDKGGAEEVRPIHLSVEEETLAMTAIRKGSVDITEDEHDILLTCAGQRTSVS